MGGEKGLKGRVLAGLGTHKSASVREGADVSLHSALILTGIYRGA